MNLSQRTIRIADTTLRDGEQTPGVRFTQKQKVLLAEHLSKMGVHALDVGFPAVSSEERQSIKEIVHLGLPSQIMTLCRPLKQDIDWASECGVKNLIIFIAVSDIHINAKFGSREKVRELVDSGVSYAVGQGFTVTFAGEDSTRAEFGFLLDILTIAVRHGASRISIPDTVGVATPEYMAFLTKMIKKAFPTVAVSMHCHDDFGMATANTIAGALAGADSLSVSINGIGERAGNAPLEEVVMTLEQLYNYHTGIDTTQLRTLSQEVAEYANVPVARNKPIVGDHAFTHESGIHIHGLLNDAQTYEPFPAELIGNVRRYVLGKHSGRSAIMALATSCGYPLEADTAEQWLNYIKESGHSRSWSAQELKDFFRIASLQGVDELRHAERSAQ